jgi:predicted nucleic acid-binding Zn ribbon protein
MKCPKCRTENPDDEIFCSNCDWRLDQKYVPERNKKRDPMMFSSVALILGAASLVMYFINIPYAAIGLGAVGLFLGGYSITLCRLVECNKNLCMALSGAGLLISIIGFIMGLAGM